MSLETSIAQFKANPSSEQAQELLALLKQGHYFILLHPSIFQDIAIRKRVEKQIQEQRLEKLPILTFHTKTQGGTIFPVFTSFEELQKFPTQSPCPHIEVSFQGLYGLVQVHPHIENIMLNPEGDALAFPRQQFLEYFASAQGQQLKAEDLPQEFMAHLEQGSRKAGTRAIKALNKAALKFPEIAKIWVLRQSNEDSSWILVLESEQERQQVHAEILRSFLSQIEALSGGICYTSYTPILEVLDTFQPAYIRPYKPVAFSASNKKKGKK